MSSTPGSTTSWTGSTPTTCTRSPWPSRRPSTPTLLRRLAWRLEGPRIDLLVSPVLSDVAGPRMSVRPAAGLPLIHLDEPSLTGPKRALKRIVDLAGRGPAGRAPGPVCLLIGDRHQVRLPGPGPLRQRPDRAVRRGVPVHQVPHDARGRRLAPRGRDRRPRRRRSPTATGTIRGSPGWAGCCAAGAWTSCPSCSTSSAGRCRWSGPGRCFPTSWPCSATPSTAGTSPSPGMTGLWQISGRKEVSWDDRMRMDLHYIETLVDRPRRGHPGQDRQGRHHRPRRVLSSSRARSS